MHPWQPWSGWQRDSKLFATHIDLGNGKMVRSEDLLDGHANNLRTIKLDHATEPKKRDLTSAVRVVAPEIAPLTDLAYTIAEKSPQSQPKDKFRADLQHALESTHRQQKVRRTLGMQPPARKEPALWKSPWFMAFVGLLLLLLVGALRSKGERSRTTSKGHLE